MTEQRIGILGGTFDPVHHGHLILARDAVEELRMDRIVFVPAAVNPFKLSDQPGAPGELRLEMLRAAVAGEPGFTVEESELRRAGPSFTFDTVGEIGQRFPAARLLLLIGEDNVPGLPKWHRFSELRTMVEFIVFRRGDDPLPGTSAFRRLSARRLDISATEIRKRVAAGRSIRYLVPEPVRALIAARRLYQPTGGPPSPLKN